MSSMGWVFALIGVFAWLLYLRAMRAAVEAEIVRLWTEGGAAPALSDEWVRRWALRASLMWIAIMDLYLGVAVVSGSMDVPSEREILAALLGLVFAHVVAVLGTGMIAWRSIRRWESDIIYAWKQDGGPAGRSRRD